MRKMNLFIFLLCIAILVAWEIYLVITGQELISVSIYETSQTYPILPFAIGVVMGHFFLGARFLIGVAMGHFFWSVY